MSTQDESMSQEDRKAQLKTAANRKAKMNDAQKWEPAEGEVLEGEYLGQRETSYADKTTPVYYIEDWNGDVYSVLGRTMMKRGMEQEGAEPGDLISVTFRGKDNAEGARGEFYDYTVVTA